MVIICSPFLWVFLFISLSKYYISLSIIKYFRFFRNENVLLSQKKNAFSIKHNANVLLPHKTHCKLYFFHLEATGSQRKSTSLHSISISIPIFIVVVQFEVTAHEHSLAIDVKSVTSTHTHLCTQIGKYDGEMRKEMQNGAEKQRAKWKIKMQPS